MKSPKTAAQLTIKALWQGFDNVDERVAIDLVKTFILNGESHITTGDIIYTLHMHEIECSTAVAGQILAVLRKGMKG